MPSKTSPRTNVALARSSPLALLPARQIAPSTIQAITQPVLVKAVDAYEQQILFIDAQAAKTVFAMRKILELHEHGALVTREAIAFLCFLDQTAGPLTEPYRDILAQAMREQALLAIGHIHRALDLGATAIAKEVFHSIRPTRKPGLLHRLIFGDHEVPPDEQE